MTNGLFPESRNPSFTRAASFGRSIIKALSTTFQNVQFIIATHSPIVISSAKDANLILLDHDQGVTYLPECYGYTVEDVLSYRQESMSRPKNIKVLIDQINKFVDDDNFNEAEENLTQLKDILGEENSEFRKKYNTLVKQGL